MTTYSSAHAIVVYRQRDEKKMCALRQTRMGNGIPGDSWRELMRQDGDDTSRRCYTEQTREACTVCVEGATLTGHADTNHHRAPPAVRVDVNRSDALDGLSLIHI